MIESNLNALAFQIHGLNAKWWYDGDRALPRNKGELLMLVVTEIAEGFEGERKGLMDDKLPHRPMAEVELVDAIVRILDYAGAYGYDLDGAFGEKLAYNAKRADHKAEAQKIAAGNPLECAAVRAPASPFTVTVNAREREVNWPTASYEDIVGLSHYRGHNGLLTVVYSHGPSQNPRGTLTPGKSVRLRDGMIFDVADTSNA